MEPALKAELDAYLEAELPRMVATQLGREATQAQVATAVTAVVAKIGESRDDPYRTTIHFLAGLLTLCLGLLAAAFSALNTAGADPQLPAYRMLGGVLGSIALVAWLGTLAAAVVQTLKFARRAGRGGTVRCCAIAGRAALMGALALLGGVAAAYCVRYGYAILAGAGAPADLPEALWGLLRLAV